MYLNGLYVDRIVVVIAPPISPPQDFIPTDLHACAFPSHTAMNTGALIKIEGHESHTIYKVGALHLSISR